jgi:hypothetical protein
VIRVSRASVSQKDIEAMTKGAGSLVRNLLAVTIPLSLGVGGLVYLISKSIVAAAVIGGGLLVASAWSNVGFFAEVRKRRDRPEGALEAIEVQATQVVEIEHLGSHGPAWVFLTDEGDALLLVGQWLLEQRRKFPSLSFTVLRWADSGRPLRVESTGRRVHPTEVQVRLEPSYTCSDIEIFRARAESLQDDLRAAFTRHS